MPNTNLILRTLTSPYGDNTLGSVLSHADLDNNFIYLKGEIIQNVSLLGANLILTKIDGAVLSVNLNSIAGGGGGNSAMVTGGTYSDITGTATFTNSTGGTFIVSGFTSGFTDTKVTGGTYSNGTITINQSDGSAPNITGITTYSASNGISQSGTTSVNFKLGGTLTEDTTINGTQEYNLKISGAYTGTNSSDALFIVNNTSATNGSSIYAGGVSNFDTINVSNSSSGVGVRSSTNSGIAVFGSSTSGPGVQANSTSSTAFQAYSSNNTSTNPASIITLNTTLGNNTRNVLQLNRDTAGTPSAGFGIAINFAMQGNGPAAVGYEAQISNVGTSLAYSSFTSNFDFNLPLSGTVARKMSLQGSGQLVLDKYGVATFGGSPTYLLGSNATGGTVEFTGAANRVVFFDSTGKIASSSGFTYATTLNSPNESTGNLSLPATSSYITFGGGRVVISSVGIPNGLNLELAAGQGSLGTVTKYPDISKTFTFKNKPWNTHLTMGHYDAPSVKFKSGAYVLTSAPYGLFGGQVVINYPSAIGAPNPIRGFWGTQGSGFNVLGVTYTEANATSTPATRTDIVANSFQIPTFSANTTVITTSQNYLTASSPLTVYSADTAGVIQSITINDGLASAFYTAGIYTLPSLGTSYTAATFTEGEMLSANTTGYIGVSFTQKIAQTGATDPGFFTGFTTGTTTYYTGVTTAVTYSSLINVYIAGAPTKGNNVFGDTYALKINSGEAYFGGGLKMKSDTNLTILSGSNSAVGTVTLIAGSKIVTNSLAKTSSTIMLTRQSNTSSSAANIFISNKTNGSFTISSSSFLDDGDVAYMIINTV